MVKVHTATAVKRGEVLQGEEVKEEGRKEKGKVRIRRHINRINDADISKVTIIQMADGCTVEGLGDSNALRLVRMKYWSRDMMLRCGYKNCIQMREQPAMGGEG